MKISKLITQYVDLKQSMGSRFHAESVILKAFLKAMGDIDVAKVEVERVLDYISGTGPVTRFWHRKHDKDYHVHIVVLPHIFTLLRNCGVFLKQPANSEHPGPSCRHQLFAHFYSYFMVPAFVLAKPYLLKYKMSIWPKAY